jgi:hypothetical protein
MTTMNTARYDPTSPQPIANSAHHRTTPTGFRQQHHSDAACRPKASGFSSIYIQPEQW